MLDITLIPSEVKALATKWANFTTQLKKDLQSNIAIDLAALIPGGTQLDTDLINACNAAITGCNALIAVADNAGLNGRLQRLGSDLTKIEHADEKHTPSFYIICFETVFNDLFGAVIAA